MARESSNSQSPRRRGIAGVVRAEHRGVVSEAAWRRSGSSVGPDDQGKTDALAPVCFTTYLITYLSTYLLITLLGCQVWYYVRTTI
jgi:hypothetical protein